MRIAKFHSIKIHKKTVISKSWKETPQEHTDSSMDSMDLLICPQHFTKAIDYTLNNINSAHTFLDDIIIITKGSIDNYEKKIMKVLSGLDKENIAISLHKCEFAQTEITWLGHKISPNGIIPTEKKTKSISEMDQPHTLKQLRSFMGSIHHMIKFISNLSELTTHLRPLLSTKNSIKGSKLKWTSKHDLAFNKIKKAITQIIEKKTLRQNKTRTGQM